MTSALQHKIRYSIDLLRKAEALALRMSPEGFHLAFSGGKDSQVLYHLALMAGVRFTAHMQITTLDPPELMRFVRRNYPDVELHRPKMSFYQLIVKRKMLPLRQVRYCCQVLKEQAGAGTVTLIGIRKAESARRSKREEVEKPSGKVHLSWDQFSREQEQSHECVHGKDKIILSPILHWSDSEVWEFIRSQGIEYCSLYDEGFHRIGCMFCPMASVKTKQLERLRYPGVERAIKRSIQTLIDTTDYGRDDDMTADEIFEWYISNKPLREFLSRRNQLKLDL